MKQKPGLNYISQLILKGEELDHELKKIRKLLRAKNIDEKGIFILFKKLINSYPSNPEVLKCFLDFLQSLNDKDLVKKVSLKEISRFYKKLCATNQFDIELNIDFFYFMYNVLDNEVESLKLYENYKRKILSSFKEFEERIEN